jgi:hypothetical protein
VAHRPAATLSNVKGKRDAPSLPTNVTCLHSTQTNRSEPTMCVSGMPGAQSCKCSCDSAAGAYCNRATIVASIIGFGRNRLRR